MIGIDVLEDSPVAQMVKNLLAMPETWIQSLCGEDPLEKEMDTPSTGFICNLLLTVT